MEKPNKKMKSIAWKMTRLWIFKKFGLFLLVDILFIAGIFIGWCALEEMNFFGEILFGASRRFIYHGGIQDTVYRVVSSQGNTMEVAVWNAFQIGRVILGTIGLIELAHLLLQAFRDSNEIKEQLEPLKEIARQTEKISSVALDETKYQRLEDAISHMNPDSTEEFLNVGDQDLLGLENAINTLIRQMRQSYQQQARFVSDASHELRTPISVIQGYVNMLDRWGKEDETVLEESIEAMKHESEHMSRLVEQLLFLARGDSGRQKMTFEPFLLNDMMEEVFEESKMIDDTHEYSLLIKTQEMIEIVGDITMLKQSARILADNARKYTKEGDEIIFGVGKNNDGESYFYVQDCGVGMKEADVAHIFERFYRSDEARNSATGGSGLGLSIAKWIVEQHKGYFEVLSRKDLGTRITVHLGQVKPTEEGDIK